MEAWLIEDSSKKCLGCLESGKVAEIIVTWTVPALALRFCRKEDAEAAAAVLAPDVATTAVEHVWT